MQDPREVTRAEAARLGAEAVAICARGEYRSPSGALVRIADAIARARAATRSIPPNAPLDPAPARAYHRTRFDVVRETTLAAARRLQGAGLAPAALNFASARSPGGGFQSGARAQEESLCRASALYTCLQGQPFYEHHERQRDPLYSSWVIDAPQVPVFRDDDGRLLDEPWPCAFLTAAAPNVKALRERSPARLAEVGPAYTERIERVLSIAAAAGYRGLVLGAWGCGAFGGDADDVAARFAAALRGPFRGAFEAVVFAILDTSPEERFIGPFLRRFAG